MHGQICLGMDRPRDVEMGGEREGETGGLEMGRDIGGDILGYRDRQI